VCFVYFWLWVLEGSNEWMDGRRKRLLLLVVSLLLLCKDKCQRKSKPEERKGVLSRTPVVGLQAMHVCLCQYVHSNPVCGRHGRHALQIGSYLGISQVSSMTCSVDGDSSGQQTCPT
jgi:hypothetical protein